MSVKTKAALFKCHLDMVRLKKNRNRSFVLRHKLGIILPFLLLLFAMGHGALLHMRLCDSLAQFIAKLSSKLRVGFLPLVIFTSQKL